MKMNVLPIAGLLALTGAAVTSRAAGPVVSCESLAKQALPEVTITMAGQVPDRGFTAPAQGNGPGGPGRGGPGAAGPGPGRGG